MIINKTQLGENWPFTVDQVAVATIGHGTGIDSMVCYILVHKFLMFALSGALESHGFGSLIDANIWADDPEMPGVKKSLTPLFEFLEGK